jgi:phosphatidylglycerophosphate synthase
VHALATKGPVVEEWADRRFFRPAGWRLARTLGPTRVSPDAVTLASLVVGLFAGHLFWYAHAWINAAGVLLFVASDVLDSADGQLARLRGTSTRMGRFLDGASDSLRFVNLYAHLGARLFVAGRGWEGAGLALAALLSHTYQAAAADYIRQAYLYFAVGTGSELDLPEQARPAGGSLWERLSAWLYLDYVRRQAWLFPRTTALVRALRGGSARSVPASMRADWAGRQAPLVTGCAWIAQNIRFALLAVTAVPGWPAAYCWIVLGPLNVVLVALVLAHERRAARELPVHAQLA